MAKGPPTLHHNTDYRDKRRRSYPETGDALDALAEIVRALDRAGVLVAYGVDLPEKTRAWLDRRDTVKTRFPKI